MTHNNGVMFARAARQTDPPLRGSAAAHAGRWVAKST